METSQIPVTPIKQAMVEIAGHSILAALVSGEQVAASFRMKGTTEREVLKLVGAAELQNLQQGDWKLILAWFRKQTER